MKQLNKKIRSGTQVNIAGIGWQIVEKRETDFLVAIVGYAGLFQTGHILNFSNKGVNNENK